MPNRRATQPLNPAAVSAADSEIYSKHADDPRPNALYDASGNRRALNPCDPGQAALRSEWMDLYVAHGGQVETGGPSCNPLTPVQPCPLKNKKPAPGPSDNPKLAHIEVYVRSNMGIPIEGAEVDINGAPAGLTDVDGFCDCGDVPPGDYTASTSKPGYGNDHQEESDTVYAASSRVFNLTLIPPIPPCNLTSETVVTKPGNRARTRVGVGERVTLTISPGPGSWLIDTGGTLDSNSGSSVEYTAGDRAATSQITVIGPGGCRSTIVFTVVEPSGGVMKQIDNTFHVHGTPSAGFHAEIYLTPSDVSFKGMTFREKHCSAVCAGYFLPQNGQDHVPGSDLVAGDVEEGVGTKLQGFDTVQGADGGIGPPYSGGTFIWPIPWEFQIGSGAPKVFYTMYQMKIIDPTGKLTMSKGGQPASAELNAPSSGY